MGIEGAGHQNDLTFDLNSTVWGTTDIARENPYH